jgi:(1->4)-alpha-D-glucan 1-alpha-D-glucosylmutase
MPGQELIADGRLQGPRLDHIDGLRDPAQYFSACAPTATPRRARETVHLVIEKTSAKGEASPPGVHGTTGYE